MYLLIIINLILLFSVLFLLRKLHKNSLRNLNKNLPISTQKLEKLKNEFDDKYHHIIQKAIATDVYSGYKSLLTYLQKNEEDYKHFKEEYSLLENKHSVIYTELSKKQEEIIYISHQMRTSLSGLISFTDFLKKTKMTEEQKDFHIAISQSAQELLNLASNMMDAKIDTKRPIEILNIDTINHKVQEITKKKSFVEILVVDDNPINRRLMKHILNEFNVSVSLAENGQEAVKLRKDHDFDIIFMDIEMPIMNGVEATISIRKYEKVYKKKESYIVAVTGQYEKSIYLNSGMNDYIPKPIDVDEIKHRIDTL
jgi:CheY-like chemotaxis protein